VGPEPLPKTLGLPRIGAGGGIEGPAVTYELLELPVPFETGPAAFLWQRLQSLLKPAEAQSYADWANRVSAERAERAWAFFWDAGLAAAPGGDVLLGLADFLRAWYPHVMAPYERRTLSFGMPGPWASPLAVALEVSLAHDLAFIVAGEVAKSRNGLSWGLIANKLTFPGGYGEQLVQSGHTVLFAALQGPESELPTARPRFPPWAARRGTLRYAADVVLHQTDKIATDPPPEPASPLVMGSFELPAGHCLVRGNGEGEQALLWATDRSVEGPGRLWTAINSARPDGLGCVLLPWRDYEPYLDVAKLPRAATSPEEIGALDPDRLLGAMWEMALPAHDQDEEARSRHVRAPLGRDWPGLAPAGPRSLSSEALAAAVSSLPPARVGVVATSRLADLAGLIGWNRDVIDHFSPPELSAVLRSWEDRFGATLFRMGGATLDLLVERPPADYGLAVRVAAEHYALCPDIIDQGAGTVAAYAHQLVGAPLWNFWWD
jgi:hypothetical protein